MSVSYAPRSGAFDTMVVPAGSESGYYYIVVGNVGSTISSDSNQLPFGKRH